MNPRRIVIGFLISAFSFTLISLINPNAWRGLESLHMSLQAPFRIVSPFPKNKYMIFEFSEEEKFNLEDMRLSKQKEIVTNLATELANKGVESVNLLLNNQNIYRLGKPDLELAVGDTNYKILKNQDLKLNQIQEEQSSSWLDRKSYNSKRRPVSDILSGTIDSKNFIGANIILISPKTEINQSRLNLFINWLDGRWVNFLKVNPIISFLLVISAGIFLTALVYWARVIGFFAISASLMLISQIAFSFFNTHIALMPILISLTTILIVSTLFDLNLISFKPKSYFKKKSTGPISSRVKASEDPELVMTTPFIEAGEHVNHNQLEAMQTKFFREQENLYEDIALSFQNRTLGSVLSTQERLNESLNSSEFSAEGRHRLELIKNDFSHLVEEIDAILFNLVPFKFENENGLLSLLELLSCKLTMLNKGNLEIIIDTNLTQIKLDSDERINSYRIIQKIIELIQENNEPSPQRKLIISINIVHEGNKLINKISYEGKPVKIDMSNLKFNEINKRLKALDKANVEFGVTELAEVADNIINHLEFSFAAHSLIKKEALQINEQALVN